jgi:kynureninase
METPFRPQMARLVGALENEVVLMNSLTVNLHLMMASFYRPTVDRFKILIEKKAFPSDYHAVISQIQLHGFDPATALLEAAPREGSVLLQTEDILQIIEEQGDSIALILFSGIQYYTGQLFDMESITKVGHAKGCKVGFDLAHAVGNVPMYLHDWGCDFACWCSYKYLNSGPGAMGGVFVHERHGQVKFTEEQLQSKEYLTPEPLRFGGWWGHRAVDRFVMDPRYIPEEGASGFRLSNPPFLMVACLKATLDVFDRAGIERLRGKSLILTSYLELLLRTKLSDRVIILTPSNVTERGAQLSLTFHSRIDTTEDNNARNLTADHILEGLNKNGVFCDIRKPNVIRIAPAPLYNSYMDVYSFVNILTKVLDECL